MKIVYQSPKYRPDLVTGRYVRCDGSKRKGYRFRVFETADGSRGPGTGSTLREYDCEAGEIPDELAQRCISSKMTEQWS